MNYPFSPYAMPNVTVMRNVIRMRIGRFLRIGINGGNGRMAILCQMPYMQGTVVAVGAVATARILQPRWDAIIAFHRL
jgi:hypothetical protein